VCNPPAQPPGNLVHSVGCRRLCLLAFVQERIREANPKTIILSGGPNSVHVEGAPRVRRSFGKRPAS